MCEAAKHQTRPVKISARPTLQEDFTSCSIMPPPMRLDYICMGEGVSPGRKSMSSFRKIVAVTPSVASVDDPSSASLWKRFKVYSQRLVRTLFILRRRPSPTRRLTACLRSSLTCAAAKSFALLRPDSSATAFLQWKRSSQCQSRRMESTASIFGATESSLHLAPRAATFK